MLKCIYLLVLTCLSESAEKILISFPDIRSEFFKIFPNIGKERIIPEKAFSCLQKKNQIVLLVKMLAVLVSRIPDEILTGILEELY